MTTFTKGQWISLELIEKSPLSKFISLYSFKIPENQNKLGTHPGEYVSCRALINNEMVIRYYSPLTPIENSKSLDLAIKYDGVGLFSKYLNDLKVGERLEFSGPIGGFKYEENNHKNLGLISGGTGISPMLQIIQSILANKNDKTNIKLLYGAVEESELIYKKELDWMAHDQRLSIYYTLDKAPENWKHAKGYITKDVIEKQFPGDEWQIVVCGPPVMCQIMDKLLFSFDKFKPENVFNFGRR